MEWMKTYKKAVTFSYDDGVLQDERFVKILNHYGIKCTFNINTLLGNEKGSFPVGNIIARRFKIEDLVPLYQGHEVASHTLTHPFLPKLNQDEIIYEVKEDINNINRIFNQETVWFAYPFGQYNDNNVSILKELGVKYARTCDESHDFKIQTDLLRFKPTCHHLYPHIFELIDEFLNSNSDEPQIFYLFGHSYVFDVDDNWDLIEKICQRLGNHSDIFYGTNQEVLL
jgi:peptidoglycan/xylan/chitin deacetylase (PgdA/CDA1 family)